MIIPLWLIWIIIGVVLIIAEIFTPGFFLLLFGVASILTGFVALFTDNLVILLSLYLVLIVILTVFLRPVFKKYLIGKETKKSNIDALIGKEVPVIEEINNDNQTGYIKVGADHFKALSKDGNVIPEGKIVVIEKFEGITATVLLKSEGEE